MREGEEGDGDESELGERGGLADRHQARLAHVRSPGGEDHLHDGDAERQDQREMAEFGDHEAVHQVTPTRRAE